MAVGITKSAGEVFAPTQSNGAARRPSLADTQRWGVEIERLLDATASNGPVFTSASAAASNLSWAANTMGWVINTTTPAENGIYRKIGGSGTGSWARVGDLPYNDVNVQAALDAAERAETAANRIFIGGRGGIAIGTATAAQLASASDICNTVGKAQGVMMWETTNNRLYVARAGSATSVWQEIGGANNITPS